MTYPNRIGGDNPREVDIDRRLARMETRIVQLMLHLGLNPYERTYATDTNQPARIGQ